MDDRKLGERGQIHVTLAAAQCYGELRRLAPETARRELLELLLDARQTREATPTQPAHYRARSRATQLDVSATVVREGRLMVVLACNVRQYR